MAWQAFGASAILLVVCACGCTPPRTCVCQDRPTHDTEVLGSDCDTKVLCDMILAKLLAHSIAICDRELGSTATDSGRGLAFLDIKRDLEGVQGLLDATYAARALQHTKVKKDLVLRDVIVAGIHECERQIGQETTADERMGALRFLRGTVLSVRDLLKMYYSTAGLQWPDDTTTGKNQTVPSPTGR